MINNRRKQMEIRAFILEYLERDYQLPKDVDIDTFDFMKSGYVDSMAVMQLRILVEDEFGIEFTDEEFLSTEFTTVAGLEKMIREKMGR